MFHELVSFTFIIFYFRCTLACTQNFGFSCKDQNNKNVDWFIIYKMPSMPTESIPGAKSGTGYYYLDSNSLQLTPSTVPINETNQALAYTLNQLYASKFNDSVFHAMYNDQQPDPEVMPEFGHRKKRQSAIYAHAKGAVFFDHYQGVWLVHSVPMFPSRYSFSFPTSGTTYGQSMLCRTFNYTELPKIATQLHYIRPYIYSSGLPASMGQEFPLLVNLTSSDFKKGEPYANVEKLVTKNGVEFTSFAKNAELGDDLYAKIVATNLAASLLTETWVRGYNITTNCSAKFPVTDVQTMKVGVTEIFAYTKDHSKLAISSDPNQPYVCIGDINRMTSQYTRGGGTNCIKHPEIWNTYFSMVQSTDPSDAC